MAGERIQFRTVDGSISPVSPYRGQTPPKLTDGFGSWTVQDRPKRVGATVWTGKPPFRMTVPVLFDGYENDNSQEDEIQRLMHMAEPPSQHEEPPKVKITGGSPRDDLVWVIENIEFGDDQIWGFTRGGVSVRYRQDAVVNLLQYIDVDLIGVGKAKSSTSRHPKHYVVKKGDTLSGIAAKMYGDRNKWKKIAAANKIKDPRKLKVGRKLIIP